MNKYLITLSLLLTISLLITPVLSLEKGVVKPTIPISYESIKILPISDQFNKTTSSGIGFTTDKDVSILQVKDTIEITSLSKIPSVIFIPADIHYKYTIQHYNDSNFIDKEWIVYPNLINGAYYIYFDADEWSYYTIDGSLIDVGITDIRLVNRTVEITGDGYDRLVLQADYPNDKLHGWNQEGKFTSENMFQFKGNPWAVVNTAYYGRDDYELSWTTVHTGTTVKMKTIDYYGWESVKFNMRLNFYYVHHITNNYYQYQFYIDNDHTSSQDVIIEAYIPDNIDYFIVEFWNGTAGAYQEVLNDSTYTAANLINLNNSSTGLDFAYYESGQRGDTVSAIYGNTSKPDQTVSAYYGVINRTLMLFTLPADDGADSATSGASQVKLRLTVYYIDPGYATYEFEDSTNQYYGLDNINGDTMMLYKAGTQNVTYLTYDSLTYSITGMTVRADENELIDYLNITFNQTPTSLAGLIINQSAIDVDTDSDSDNVPDAFEDENITVNKGQQGGELKWNYVWEGVFNIVNSTGYIYYTNLINGSGLVGTEIQTAGTQNMSMNTAGAGETFNFTIHSGTSDYINVTAGLDTNSVYILRYSNDTFVEGQSTDANQYANFTVDLSAGTYYIEESDIVIWLFNSTSGTYSNTTTDILQPCQGFLAYITQPMTWTRSDL